MSLQLPHWHIELQTGQYCGVNHFAGPQPCEIKPKITYFLGVLYVFDITSCNQKIVNSKVRFFCYHVCYLKTTLAPM